MQQFIRYIFESIHQDIAPDKRPTTVHKNIVNMETFLTARGMSLKASRGTSQGISFPAVGSPPTIDPVYIIGHQSIGLRLFIWVTSNKGEPNIDSYDAIIEVVITDASIQMFVKKEGNWSLSTLNPIMGVGIKENEISSKLYWVDGHNQTRYCNVDNPDKYEPVDYVLAKPSPGIVTATSYGISASVTAVVRYGFTQYNVGGSESKLSPLSGPVNISPEIGSAQVICTSMLNSTYTNYRLYRLMWVTYNDAPTINIVDEGIIPDDNKVTFIDSGGSFLAEVSILEFIDIGSDLIIPEAIGSKKQILFFANYSTDSFDIQGDMRAYSYGVDSIEINPIHEEIPADTGKIVLRDLFNPSYLQIVTALDSASAQSISGEYHWSGTQITFDQPGIYWPETTNTKNLTVYVNVLSVLIDGQWSTREGFAQSILRTGPGEDDYIKLGKGVVLPHLIDGYTPITLPTDNMGLMITVIKPVKDLFTPYTAIINTKIGYKLLSTGTTTVKYSDIPDSNGYTYTIDNILLEDTAIKVSINFSWTDYVPAYEVTNFVDRAIILVDFTNMLVNPAIGTKSYFSILNLNVEGYRQELISGGIVLQDKSGSINSYSSPQAVPITHDAINPDYTINKYTSAGGPELGAEGIYTKLVLSIAVDPLSNGNTTRYFKAGEVYRVGIVWFDVYGRTSPAKWVADLMIPYVELTDDSNYHYVLSGSVIKEFPEGATAFKFVVVERKLKDKSIILQGISQPISDYIIGPDSERLTVGSFGFSNMREFKGTGTDVSDNTENWFSTHRKVLDGQDWSTKDGKDQYSVMDIMNTIHSAIHSPETFLYPTDIPANKIEVVGLMQIETNKDRTVLGYWDNVRGDAYQQVFNSIEFDIRNKLNDVNSGAPSSMFEDFTSFEDKETDNAEWMFSRTAKKFFKGTAQNFDIILCSFLDMDSVTQAGSTVVSSTIDATDFAGVIDAENKCQVTMTMPPYYIIEANTDWLRSGANAVPYSLFKDGIDASFGDTLANRGFPIVELRSTAINQYNGNSYASKTTNIYIDASEAQESINKSVTLFGDTYVGIYAIPKTSSSRSFGNPLAAAVYDYVFCLLESAVCVDYANSKLRAINGELSTSIASSLQLQDVAYLLDYDKVFSQIPNTVVSISKGFNYVDIETYLTRVTSTIPKVVGETIDNWTKVNFGNYMDLESQFGPVVKLVRVMDILLAFQPQGIAKLSILPTAQTTSSSGVINLGKGKVLDDYDYIVVDAGCNNKQAIAVQGNQVFFIDTINKTLSSIEEGSISTLQGFNSVTQDKMTDNVSRYIVNGGDGFVFIDENTKQVLFKFSPEFPILVYNYVKKAFLHSRTYDASYFLSFGRLSLAGKSNKLFILNKGPIGNYFDEEIPASIEMVVEPLPGVDKVFDGIEVVKQGEGNFEGISIKGSSGRVSGDRLLPIIWKSKYDIHSMHLPRVENSRNRWRERNIEINLSYSGIEDLNIDEIMVKFSAKK